MSIRTKTLIVICLTLLALLGMLYFTSQWFLLHNAIITEEETTKRDVTRLLAALNDEVVGMDSTVGDWAPWDDTYAFIKSGDPAYIESNLPNVTFTNLGIELMLFIENSGQIVFGKMIDLESEVEVPVPESLYKELQTSSRLLNHKDPSDKLAGILTLPDGPMIVASQPILTSLGEGPISGTLIMGRRLDDAEITKLSQKTQLSIRAFQYDDSVLPDDVALVRNSLVGAKPIIVSPQSETIVSGYTLVNDVFGNPALILRIETPREAFTQAKTSLLYLGLAMLAIGVVLGLVMMYLLERMVIVRLTGLNSNVLKIGNQGTTSSRVKANGNDEIFVLASSVNSMLDSLENSRVKELESEERFRSLYENASIGIYRTTPGGLITMANPALVTMLGYSSVEELMQRDLTQEGYEPTYSRQDFQKTIEQNGKISGLEFTWKRKDGSIISVRESARVVQDENNQPIYYEGTVEDITERKRAEVALYENEQRLASIYNTVGDVIFYLAVEPDQQYRFTSVNPAFCKVTGIPPEGVIGRKVNEIIPEPSLSLVLGKYKQAIDENTLVRWEETTDYPTGRLVGEVSIAPVFDEAGDCTFLVGSVHDITARVKVDQALRESENLLKESQIVAGLGSYVLDIPSGLWKNSEFLDKLFGIDKTYERSVDGWTNLIHPEDRAMMLDYFSKEVIGQRRMFDKDYRIVRPSDQAVRWVHGLGRLEFNSDGQPQKMIGTIQDITARRQAEKLQDAIYRIAQAADQTKNMDSFYPSIHAIIKEVMDADNFYIALYDEKEDLLSFPYSVDELDPVVLSQKPGKGLTEYVLRTAKPLLCDDNLFESLRQRGEVDLVGIASPIWLGVPLVTNGKAIGVMVVQDYKNAFAYGEREQRILEFVSSQAAVTINRKRAEEALRETSEHLTHMIANSPTVIYALKVEGDQAIPYWFSENIESVLGFKPEDALQSTWWQGQIYPEDLPNVHDSLEHLFDDFYQHEYRLRRKDGQLVWLHDEHRLLRSPDDQPWEIIGSWTDITERKLAEEALQNYNLRLEADVAERTRELRDTQERLVRQEKLAVLGQLAGGIGHELRNPLGIINNAIYYLRLIQPDADEKVKKYLEIIQTETRTADKIITDLLDFSRLKSLDKESVQVIGLIKQTLKRFPVPGNVRVTVKVPDDLPTLLVDPQHMTQVLGNLVVNACQAMVSPGSTKGASNGGTVVITAARNGKEAAIAVKDTGVGIPPENIAKIFEPLFTTKPAGIGLGLAVCKKLVEANDGRIEVQSEPGKGSTFTVYVPLERQEIASP